MRFVYPRPRGTHGEVGREEGGRERGRQGGRREAGREERGRGGRQSGRRERERREVETTLAVHHTSGMCTWASLSSSLSHPLTLFSPPVCLHTHTPRSRLSVYETKTTGVTSHLRAVAIYGHSVLLYVHGSLCRHLVADGSSEGT